MVTKGRNILLFVGFASIKIMGSELKVPEVSRVNNLYILRQQKARMSESSTLHSMCVLLENWNLSIYTQVMARRDYKMSIIQTFTTHLKVLVFLNINEKLN